MNQELILTSVLSTIYNRFFLPLEHLSEEELTELGLYDEACAKNTLEAGDRLAQYVEDRVYSFELDKMQSYLIEVALSDVCFWELAEFFYLRARMPFDDEEESRRAFEDRQKAMEILKNKRK